jgi:hypothetical protein
MKVIDNLQVYIDDFHVRYEDFSNPAKPFSVGVTMSGIHIRSTDSNWEEMFMTEFTDVTYKVRSEWVGSFHFISFSFSFFHFFIFHFFFGVGFIEAF